MRGKVWMPPADNFSCEGLYCGRVVLPDGNLSECGACPSGFRVNQSGLCTECLRSLDFYEWNYVVFMALVLPLVLHFFFIDATVRKNKPKYLLLYVCAVLESLLSLLFTVLVFKPRGRLDVFSCQSQQLSDWYTIFYNPSPDFVHVVHCTQEAVFPLRSMLCVHYLFSVVLLLVMRLTLTLKLAYININGSSISVYSALFFYPILLVVHFVFAGLLYYSFPYVVLVGSLVTNVVHFSAYESKLPGSLFIELFQSPRNVSVVLMHWLLHAFGLVALLGSERIWICLPLLCLVPVPAFFYILTSPFTDPKEIDKQTTRWQPFVPPDSSADDD